MPATADRLDLRLSTPDKDRLRRAAALAGVSVAAFVREAAVREAEAVLANPPRARAGSLAERLRGRAAARLSTDEIMRLTRGA
jgi:uncharacterized protein (DUF1778 family)